MMAKAKTFLFGTRRRVLTTIFAPVFLAGVALALWLALPLVIDAQVSEAFDATNASLLFTGQFVGTDRLHAGAGTANIYEQDDGSLVLRFESDFDVTNGPRLLVYLSDLAVVNGSTTAIVGSEPENYYDLGSLKGNVGSQNYEIPPDVDLDRYKSVLIWCEPFRFAFALAPFRDS